MDRYLRTPRFSLALPIACLLMVEVGFQLYNFMLQHTHPFYYHSVIPITPEVERGDDFIEELDVERFRICKVEINRFMVNVETGIVFFRETLPGGATVVGRNRARNRVPVPHDAPLGKVKLIQNVSSHCIEGMHTMAWPLITFEIVEKK